MRFLISPHNVAIRITNTNVQYQQLRNDVEADS